jgi:hypothetical protein
MQFQHARTITMHSNLLEGMTFECLQQNGDFQRVTYLRHLYDATGPP